MKRAILGIVGISIWVSLAPAARSQDVITLRYGQNKASVKSISSLDLNIALRKGFLARVRLEPFGSGKIYPHEETLAGPKADRLKLFHATAMNLSPQRRHFIRRSPRGIPRCSVFRERHC